MNPKRFTLTTIVGKNKIQQASEFLLELFDRWLDGMEKKNFKNYQEELKNYKNKFENFTGWKVVFFLDRPFKMVFKVDDLTTGWMETNGKKVRYGVVRSR